MKIYMFEVFDVHGTVHQVAVSNMNQLVNMYLPSPISYASFHNQAKSLESWAKEYQLKIKIHEITLDVERNNFSDWQTKEVSPPKEKEVKVEFKVRSTNDNLCGVFNTEKEAEDYVFNAIKKSETEIAFYINRVFSGV